MKFINIRGDLFATVFSFGAAGIIRLASSLILTRLLYPEAYGVVAALTAIAFAIQMLSDIGVLGFMVRDKNADELHYIHTAWTLRLIRNCFNAALLFALAPWIAALYKVPELTGWLRVYSVVFVFLGLESMSFTLAIRHKKARIVSYTELVCSLLSTLFVITFSYFSRDESGMVYGMVLERFLRTVASHFFYRHIRPRLQIDRQAARDLLGFSKYVIPSSWLALIIGQFDKIVFLRLFDLKLLGLYGLGGSIAGPVDSLVTQVSRTVLFARCAANFRADPLSYRERYYRENVKIFALTLFLPAAVGGASHFIIDFLYDPRYAYASVILQAFALRSMLIALSSPVENLLTAADDGVRVVLVANVLRAIWLVPAALIGYHLAGFEGFLYGAVLKELPAVVYFFWLQHKRRLMIVRYELMKLAFMISVFFTFVFIGPQLMSLRLVLIGLWNLVRG